MKMLKEKETFTLNERIDLFFNSEINHEEVIEKLFAIKKPNWWHLFFTDDKNRIETNVLEELDIFTNVNLFSKLDRTKTIFGKYILKKLLYNPTHKLDILSNRKEFLKYLTNNKQNLNNINEQIETIKNLDKSYLWYWRENDEHSDFIYNMIYFQTPYLQFLNKNELFLRFSNFYKIVVSPLFVTFSPLLYIILPFILLKFMKVKIPFKVLVKMMWSGSTQMISLPFIKEIKVVGLTQVELEEELTKKLSKYIERPIVSVIIEEINSLKIFVVGNVNEPGVFNIKSEVTVLQAISMAGGFIRYAKKSKIKIFRKHGEIEKVITLNYNKIISGRNPELNIPLQPGDTIVVP